eukprot:gene7951-12418_t
MKQWKVILLSGEAGSGKDTLADYLEKKENYKKISFGEEMKIQCSKKFGIPMNFFVERSKKDALYLNTGKTPRDYLIEYASEKRKEDEDYFTKKSIESLDVKGYYVISDCRFKREIDFVRNFFDFGILSVWIQRNQVKVVNDNSTLRSDQCDICIDNSNDEFDGRDLLNQILTNFEKKMK